MSDLDSTSTDASHQLARGLAFAEKTLRHYRVIIGAVAAGVVACAVFLLVRTPPYRSETVILYSDGIRTSTDALPAGGATPEAAVRFREMLMSRQRLEQLIERFDLYPDIRQDYGMVDAVEEFRKHIEFRAPGSDTYTIGFKGTSAEQARDVTLALSESLMAEDAAMRSQKAQLTRDFLAEERKRTEKTLRDREQDLAEFLADHPTFALDSMLLMPGAPQTGAAIRAAEAEQTTQAGPPRGGGRRFSGVSRSAPIPAELISEKTRAEADLHAARSALATAQARFTAQHPDVRAAQGAVQRGEARLASVTAAIAAHVSRVAAAPVRPAPQARRPSKDDGPKAPGTDELVALETDWTRLVRDVSQARARHEQIEASYFKADIAANSETDSGGTRMAVLDPAYLPTRPAPPGRTVIAGIFVGLSLVLGSVAAMLVAALDDRIFRPRDLEVAGLPLLSAVPRSEG